MNAPIIAPQLAGQILGSVAADFVIAEWKDDAGPLGPPRLIAPLPVSPGSWGELGGVGAFQYYVSKRVWPEVEVNYTHGTDHRCRLLRTNASIAQVEVCCGEDRIRSAGRSKVCYAKRSRARLTNFAQRRVSGSPGWRQWVDLSSGFSCVP